MIVCSDLKIDVRIVAYSTTLPKNVGSQEEEAIKATEILLKQKGA